MRTPLATIGPNESSFNVALWHRVLEALGLPVAKKEVAQQKAGPDTQAKVRALQKQLDLALDPNLLVDEATVAAVSNALEKRGLTEPGRSFRVSGTVRLPDGRIRRRQRVVAFDLDLRAV